MKASMKALALMGLSLSAVTGDSKTLSSAVTLGYREAELKRQARYSGGHFKTPNQRQKRKMWRNNPSLKAKQKHN